MSAQREVRLTNPDKLLFADVEISKRALADYYSLVAKLLLQHTADRPLAVLRCPDGHDSSCFFQKHPDTSLKALPSVKIKESGSKQSKPYIYIHSKNDLLQLAQANVLEIHASGVSVTDLEQPDILVIDLDPDESVSFADLKRAAFLVRDTLKEVGLSAFLRSTGGKGLHIVTPLKPKAGWEEVKGFAEHLANTFAQSEPKFFTANMSKAKRKGKIFIDYLRNGRGATAIASYSTRAKSGAPIAMPLSWETLKSARKLPIITFKTVERHLKDRDEDPWQGFRAKARTLPGL